MEIIEEELRKIVRCSLDGVRVFHTIYRCRVAPLAERTQPMWKYSGPSDLDRASPEELPDDKVWSHIGGVLQLKPKERVNGKPAPFNSAMVSRLVCSLPFSLCFFLYIPVFLFQDTRSVGAWSLQVPAAPSQETGGRGLAGRPEGGGGC